MKRIKIIEDEVEDVRTMIGFVLDLHFPDSIEVSYLPIVNDNTNFSDILKHDFIIVDYKLRGSSLGGEKVNGIQVVSKLLGLGYGRNRIAFMTGFERIQTVIETSDIPDVKYIEKPPEVEPLIKLFQEILDL